MTDFSTTLIRCSALPLVMTPPRGKSNMEKYLDAKKNIEDCQTKYDALKNKEGKMGTGYLKTIADTALLLPELYAKKDVQELSDTCKSYLIQSYVLEKYGRIREIQTKQMVKGVITEEDAIDLLSMLDRRNYVKNTKRISNDYITGLPDLYDGDDLFSSNEVIDIKSCWDIFTFLKYVDQIESAESPECIDYYWQIQGYLWLTGAKIGTLAFCLVNTPDSIIEGEKYVLLRRMDVVTEEAPEFKEELAKLIINRKFDDIHMNERVLTYSIDRNDDDIEKISKTVDLCRDFLAEFEEKHLHFSKNHRKTYRLQHVV